MPKPKPAAGERNTLKRELQPAESHVDVSALAVPAIAAQEIGRMTRQANAGEPLSGADTRKLALLQRIRDRAKAASAKAAESVSSHAIDRDRLTIEQTAYLLDQSRKTLESWSLREGAPRNTDKTFSLPALFAWRIARADSAARQLSPEAADEDQLYRRIKRMLAERKLWSTDLDLIFVDRAREIIVNVAHLVAAAFDAIERDLPKQICELRTGEATEAAIRRRIAHYFRDRRQSLADAPKELLIGMEADACEPPERSREKSAAKSTSRRPSRSPPRGAKRSNRASDSRARRGSKGTSS